MKTFDKYLKARELRNRYKTELLNIVKNHAQKNKDFKTLPVYFENWAKRILKLENLIIDLKI
jgi:hypothetical protein